MSSRGGKTTHGCHASGCIGIQYDAWLASEAMIESWRTRAGERGFLIGFAGKEGRRGRFRVWVRREAYRLESVDPIPTPPSLLEGEGGFFFGSITVTRHSLHRSLFTLH